MYKPINKLSHTKPRKEVALCESLATNLWGFVLSIKKTFTMRKTIVFGMLLGLILPCSTFAAFDVNLKYGSSGSSVKEVQEFLISQGSCSITPTGNFFALTLKCIKDFQSKQGITPVSGYWGPITRAKASTMLDLSASDTAEVAETGKIEAPVITQEMKDKAQLQFLIQQNAQQISSGGAIPSILVASPAPTCTIKTERIQEIPGIIPTARVHWTSTNATKGVLEVSSGYDFTQPAWDLSKDIIDNDQPRGNTIARGYSLSYMLPQIFQVDFEGPGGTVKCRADIMER